MAFALRKLRAVVNRATHCVIPTVPLELTPVAMAAWFTWCRRGGGLVLPVGLSPQAESDLQCAGPASVNLVTTWWRWPSRVSETSPATSTGRATHNSGSMSPSTVWGTTTGIRQAPASMMSTVAGWYGSAAVVWSMSAMVPR